MLHHSRLHMVATAFLLASSLLLSALVLVQACTPGNSRASAGGGSVRGMLFTHSIPRAGEYPHSSSQLSASNSTAVLFLIDESGGVNGQCTGTRPEEVLIVDAQEKARYEIVRFFFTLMGSYHKQNPAGHHLKVGLAQFARTYELVFPLTDTSHLFEAQEWSNLYNHLSQGTFTLKSLSTCHTNFADAFKKAARDLSQSGAKNRILVLISDGSFRGSETGASTAAQHEDARRSTRDELEELATTYGVKTHVILLGSDRCFDEQNCDLTRDNWLLRGGDIEHWRAWENTSLPSGDKLIETLIDREPFHRLVSEFQHFLPTVDSAQWASQSGGKLSMPRYACSAAVTAVTVHSVDDHQIRLLDDRGSIVKSASPEPNAVENVFRWDVRNPPVVPPVDSCGEVTWTLNTDDNEAYYWSRKDLPPFAITHLDLVPRPPIILNSSEITVEVKIGGVPLNDFNRCYQVKLALLAGENEITSTVEPVSEHMVHELAFTSLSPQTLTLRAQIRLSDDPEVILSKQEITAWAQYEAELLVNDVSSEFSSGNPKTMGPGDTVTISFPIRYGSPQYVPGFSPVFSLTSRIAELGTVPPSGCRTPGSQGVSLPYGNPKPSPRENALVYSVVVSYTGHWEENCGYRYVDVAWNGSSHRYDISHAPPTLVPTEPPEPPVWLWVIPLLLILALLIMVATIFGYHRN